MSNEVQRGLSEPRVSWVKTILLTLLVLTIVVLHQDWWFWSDARIIGFLPVGLAYHAAYSVVCALLMWLLVRIAWPKHLETLEQHASVRDEGGH